MLLKYIKLIILIHIFINVSNSNELIWPTVQTEKALWNSYCEFREEIPNPMVPDGTYLHAGLDFRIIAEYGDTMSYIKSITNGFVKIQGRLGTIIINEKNVALV